MKRFILLFIISAIAFSCSNTKKWSARDRAKFIDDCAGAAKSMGEAKARAYCECMQPKLEAKYPTVAEANRVSASDLQSEEWTKEVKKCLGMETTDTNENTSTVDDPGGDVVTTGAAWSEEDRASWSQQCSQSLAGQNWTEVAEKGYCDCVREKLEQKYANFAEMNQKGTYEDGVNFGKQCTDFLIKGGRKQ